MVVPMGGEMVCLTWNHSLPNVMANAGGAALHILDGGHARDVLLDRDELANGFLTYRPGSNDVTFKLQVHAASGQVLVGSVRFLAAASGVAARSQEPQAGRTHETVPVVVISNERHRSTSNGTGHLLTRGTADRTSAREGLARFVVRTPGARITIRRLDALDSDERVVSSDSMRLPAGRWMYQASAPGFNRESGRFLVNSAGPADIFIRLQPTQLTGANRTVRP